MEFNSALLFGVGPYVHVKNKCFYSKFVGSKIREDYAPDKPPDKEIRDTPHEDKEVTIGYVIGGDRNGYAHWVYEQLPKLYWYRRYIKKTGLRPTLIVSGTLSEWHHRSLVLLGHNPCSYVRHTPNSVIRFDRLLIPPHPRRTRGGEFQVCPTALRWVRNEMRSSVEGVSIDYPKRLYVSRRSADRRQVVNSGEVIGLIERHGLRALDPGGLSLDEQVQLFSGAQLIVGPHGGGLANIIYATDSKVLELITTRSGEHFFVLSLECGHRYTFMTCDEVGHKNRHPRNRDMHVDLEKLDFYLRRV